MRRTDANAQSDEAQTDELDDEAGFEFDDGGSEPEMLELQLATELIGVDREEELDQFLGSLIRRATGAAGNFLKSQAGQQLSSLLKSAARRALPQVGHAIGGHIGGARGARLGSQLADGAGQLLGLELEGLSNEDSEFELARQFVRFANASVAGLPGTGATANDARRAFVAAARVHAPGLANLASAGAATRIASTSGLPGLNDFPRTGRWHRHGRTLVLT